jgi:hypothetical protein
LAGYLQDPMFTPQEKFILDQFVSTHKHSEGGRFIVQLPRKPDAKPLGESRGQAVRRFLSLEQSLRSKGRFKVVNEVIQEYFELRHLELVPTADLNKHPCQVFYFPIHVVQKESSTTIKVRAVFDASVKSTTNVSLNDTLVGPTIHSLCQLEALIRHTDSEFGSPSKIDLLLGVDIFIAVLLNGWRFGPPGSPWRQTLARYLQDSRCKQDVPCCSTCQLG